MRIIETTYVNPKICECQHCKAILEYTPADVQKAGQAGDYINCPLCFKQIEVGIRAILNWETYYPKASG